MFDFDRMLRSLLHRTGDPGTAISTPFDLPDRVCRDLIAEGLACGVVKDSVADAALDDRCVGWWIDRASGRMHLRLNKASTVLIAGVPPDRRVTPSLLLEARLKGVRRVVTADAAGDVIEDLDVTDALCERLERIDGGTRACGPSYDDAFEMLYRLIGDRLRMPAQSFVGSRAALCLGTLGPGGAERQGSYTAAGARHHGFETVVICNHLAPPADFFKPYVEAQGVQVIEVPSSPVELQDPVIADAHAQIERKFASLNFSSVFVEVIRYASVLRECKPRILHCWMDFPNVLCGTAAALVGVPALVLSCRSMAPYNFAIFQPYMRPGYAALLARRRPLILNNSRAGADDYARWLGIDRSRVQVVHNGFDFPPKPAPDVRTRHLDELGIPPGATVVGSILRFSEEKRPGLLVDMAATALRHDPHVHFVFYGTGPLYQSLNDKIRKEGLADRVHLPGLTTAAWEALAAMDVFVLASRLEGLPNVLIEAQASGVPIVCTGAGGMPETYVDGVTGLTVPDANAEALASAVLALLNDPERRDAMSRRAEAHARAEFGLDKMIREITRVYGRMSEPEEQWLPARMTA